MNEIKLNVTYILPKESGWVKELLRYAMGEGIEINSIEIRKNEIIIKSIETYKL